MCPGEWINEKYKLGILTIKRFQPIQNHQYKCFEIIITSSSAIINVLNLYRLWLIETKNFSTMYIIKRGCFLLTKRAILKYPQIMNILTLEQIIGYHFFWLGYCHELPLMYLTTTLKIKIIYIAKQNLAGQLVL